RFLPDRAAEALGVRCRAPTAQRPTPNAEWLQVGQMGRMGQILYRREVRRWGAPRPPQAKEAAFALAARARSVDTLRVRQAACLPPNPLPSLLPTASCSRRWQRGSVP